MQFIHFFDDLVLEKDVVEDDVDQIEVFCKYYAKHVGNKAKFTDIRRACEFQIFVLICVCAWEKSVSKSGQYF